MYRKQLERVAVMRNTDLDQGGVKRIMKLKKFKNVVPEGSSLGKKNDSLKKSTSMISNGSSNKDKDKDKDNKETIKIRKN